MPLRHNGLVLLLQCLRDKQFILKLICDDVYTCRAEICAANVSSDLRTILVSTLLKLDELESLQ